MEARRVAAFGVNAALDRDRTAVMIGIGVSNQADNMSSKPCSVHDAWTCTPRSIPVRKSEQNASDGTGVSLPVGGELRDGAILQTIVFLGMGWIRIRVIYFCLGGECHKSVHGASEEGNL